MENSILLVESEEEAEMNKITAGLIIGIASLGLTLDAQALGVEKQAPLVYPVRDDGAATKSADVSNGVYEYNLNGPQTFESEIFKTTGTIQIIGLYYDSIGRIEMEVSANGGGSYTKIINGAVIGKGFIPGNKLRFRAHIYEGATLKKVVLGYKDTSGVDRIYRNPEFYGFTDKKALYIYGGEEDLFNYPLEIKFDQDLFIKGVKSDYSDVRFAASDGQTPLYYYLEKGSRFSVLGSRDSASTQNLAPSTSSAIFYVKVPQIPKEGTMIYVYYGNKDAVSKSDPNNAFPFYDDFSTEELDSEKWQIGSGIKKECGNQAGYLRLHNCLALSRDYKMGEGILEFKAMAEENASIQAIIDSEYKYMVYSSNYPGAEHTIAINDMAKLNIGNAIKPFKEYIYKVRIGADGLLFERYDKDYNKEAEIQFMNMGSLIEGYIGLKAGSAPLKGGSVYFDWVRTRPYIKNELIISGQAPDKKETQR
ncbi:MAG: DUF2341 domain-containing protein [Candidatus Omnitrophota bacterium]